jgi:hypothetical protein
MKIAFVDESGDPSLNSGSRYLIVAAIMVSRPRPLALHIRRARRALRTKLRGAEFKARHAQPKEIERLLTALAEEDISIVVIAVETSASRRLEGEKLYQETVARLVKRCVYLSPRLRVVLDKRYTNRKQQNDLETTIREAITDVPNQLVVIEPMDSTASPELQAVDFVAWAFGQNTNATTITSLNCCRRV